MYINWLFIILISINFLIKLINILRCLQLNNYSVKNVFFNIFNISICNVFLCFNFIICFILCNICIIHSNIVLFNTIILYYILTNTLITKVNYIMSINNKVPFVITNRIKRIYFFSLLIYVIFIALFFKFSYLIYYKMLIILLFNLIAFCICILAYYLLFPFEIWNNKRYINKTKKLLFGATNLFKIGITGSYGKTSVKNILYDILSIKYSVLKTLKNYNTPLGIARTVIGADLDNFQFGIFEMGAKKVGEINELCEIVAPKFAILTSIGIQHLQTFKSLDNIYKTKKELVDFVENMNGCCVFNCDNKLVNNIYKKCRCEKISVSLRNSNLGVFDYIGTNIISDNNGSSFDLYYLNNFIYRVETNLLGSKNVLNIIMCIALCKKLKMSFDEIRVGLLNIKNIQSRLEKFENGNGCIVLNNSYNSNIDSCELSFEVLGFYNNMTKYVITPGLIELDNMSFELNYEFARKMSRVCDYVCIINKVNKNAIYKSLIDNNFDKNHILFFNTFLDCKKTVIDKLDKNSVVLIENDLPDNYK